MRRLDRYIVQALVGALWFFVLVFTGVIWLTQAVRLVDTVIASGEGAKVFLEFSTLVLPQVFVIVLPLSGMGAALYALNRLHTDSELVVMMGAGYGPPSMLKPVAIFGAMIGVAMLIVMTVLVPRSSAILSERTQAIRSDLANALIVERQFIHPVDGLTLFITDTSRTGEMAGIFLNDQRDPARPVTYSAKKALLLRDGDEARLVMLEGVAMAPGSSPNQLTSVSFDQFVFDLSDMLKEEGVRVRRPSEYSVPELLRPSPEMLAVSRYTLGNYLAEGHYKLAMPLISGLFPLIALVTLLSGGFRRSGFGRRVIVAVGVATLLMVLLFVARGRVPINPSLWPLMYLPSVIAIVYVAVLTLRLSRSRVPRSAAT